MNSTPLDMCNIDELVQLSPHALETFRKSILGILINGFLKSATAAGYPKA